MELLLPGSPMIFLLAWFGWRIAAKAGYSGFWGLTALVPPLGLLALWYLAATKDWPVSEDRGSRHKQDGEEQRSNSITIRRPSEPVKQRS